MSLVRAKRTGCADIDESPTVCGLGLGVEEDEARVVSGGENIDEARRTSLELRIEPPVPVPPPGATLARSNGNVACLD